MSAQEQRLRQVVDGWHQRNQWPHALLLSGASPAHRLELAIDLAKRRLCEHATACGQCPSCRLFASSNHLDYHVLASPVSAQEFDLAVEQVGTSTARRVIRKEQIAATLRQLALHAQRPGGWRVLLLLNPEELHRAAANALLKSLEEPSERVFFILVSNQPRAVLETIVSRCQQLALPPPSRSDITRQLMDEGCSGSLAPTLAELQRRGVPCAESELVERRALIMTWLDAVAKNSEHGRLLAVDRLNKDPAPDQVLALALSLTLDLMRLQSGLSPDEITHQDLASELSALAATGSWLGLSQSLQRARGAVQRNVRLSSLLMGASR